MEKVNIDEINEIMTKFLDNVVSVAKLHTEYKEKLGDEHEYTKFTCSMVKIFNQYQELYVYINDQEEYANKLVNLSNLVLEALKFKPYELLEGSFFKKRKELKNNKEAKEAAFKKVNEFILDINSIVDSCIKMEDSSK